MTRAAHQLGKMVRTHVASKQGILESARAGVDVLDHADYMDGECVDALLQAGAYVTPSLYFYAVPKEMGLKVEKNDRYYANYEEIFERMTSLLPEMHAAGVKMMIGDDFGNGLPGAWTGKMWARSSRPT